MGEHIKDRMNRLYREYQQERQVATSPTSTTPPSESEGAPRAQSSRENIDAAASSEELRKARAHRLIETGAICEQYLGTREMTAEQVSVLLGRISKLEGVKEILGGDTFSKRGADERNI